MKNLQEQQNTYNNAWIFPGQGSQRLGMGIDLLKYSLARARFKQAKKILGWSVLEVCQNWQKLNLTCYTQPCIFVIQAILIDILKQTKEQPPNLMAGYSLGEYSALYASEVFDFETGLELIKRRAEIMYRAPKGTMVTLIGFNQQQLEQAIMFTPNVWRVNDSAKMAIISGTVAGVKLLLTKIDVRRIIPLNVSGAFHTPLLKKVVAEFAPILQSTPFNSAKVPFLSSIELVAISEPNRLKNSLIKQITEPVQWEAITCAMAELGIKRVVEISSAKNLTSQMKGVVGELILTNISTLDAHSSFASTSMT